jgi:hypothetical protein
VVVLVVGSRQAPPADPEETAPGQVTVKEGALEKKSRAEKDSGEGSAEADWRAEGSAEEGSAEADWGEEG